MKIIKAPSLTILLYTLAALLMLYTSWSLYHNYQYINEMFTYNQLQFSGNEYDVIHFFMMNSVQYGIFAFLLFTLGKLLHNYKAMATSNKEVHTQILSSLEKKKVKEEEIDFEEWFNKNEQ